MSEGEITGAMERLGITREEAVTVEYLGDGVYASDDGYQLWLRTLDGGPKIALDRHAYTALVNFHDARMIARRA